MVSSVLVDCAFRHREESVKLRHLNSLIPESPCPETRTRHNPSPPTRKWLSSRWIACRPLAGPRGAVVMRQNWRDLLFLHWAFDPTRIRPLIPADLELDLFEGMAYVGLVPFTMTGVRPIGLPAVVGLSNFHETNVANLRAPRRSRPWSLVLQSRRSQHDSSPAGTGASSIYPITVHRCFLNEKDEIPPSSSSRFSMPVCGTGPRLFRPLT